MAGGGIPIATTTIAGGFLTGKKLIFPIALITSLFFLWGFSYGLLDVLNKHFQNVLGITKLESTGLQVMYFGGGYLIFSPIAAEVLKRFGYKICILMGLSLYSIGAVMFWPTAHFSSKENASASFGGFCACTLVIACGLATLETAANSYAVVIGDPKTASPRLQFCQAWNGVASFIGPLIASKAFFSGKNADNLTNVQFVYLGVACLGVAVAILFVFAKLPEVAEEAKRNNSLVEPEHDLEGRAIGQGSIWKEYNMICGFIAQFCYVGAQVTIGAFFINYAVDNAGWAETQASNLLSYALITFTVGRFIATGLATVLSSSFIMVLYSIATIALNAYVCAGKGKGSIGAVMAIYFFMAPMYPTIFTMGTANLGIHTRRGAGILVMGVAGGAVFSPIQGAIADAANTRISFVVPLVGFLVVLAYVGFHWVGEGFAVLRVKTDDAIVAAAGVEGGAVITKRSMSITEQQYVGEIKN
ncbi:L-fucose:H+ symporter permease-like protein [Aureobasidium pullulans]|uniref:L-fucose:H+ symporter permease-like protein n=2 Tax=Aureobasidium pullulans TaxID=5580 RepID=A0A074XP02_AURPU|nr:L-fucose:H+ symporter permease-like protein [Aureobasidium pullulans EXF-150]THV64617.1 L-fucose:H+ symporter permease-like protein [Aureobasidium pullulans]KEQ87235.1 L-fucose:H+ symporter permease-like protein [Aureobasidium pullulans EXF-150]THW61955.1 L-fucose:H+ symporter permease-like protein [Aureobasidium pullulans]THY26444.1 L-fucose:H+ symporter permease-like protein [Aureobasidium pullulans]THY49835.1 L-fucose:H+ symporter permease-like protein [Aureobasidium pullulans]